MDPCLVPDESAVWAVCDVGGEGKQLGYPLSISSRQFPAVGLCSFGLSRV